VWSLWEDHRYPSSRRQREQAKRERQQQKAEKRGSGRTIRSDPNADIDMADLVVEGKEIL